MLKYKRILLKLSGEALAGEKEFGFSDEVLESFAKQIKDLQEEFEIETILLKPLCSSSKKAKEILNLYAKEVKPYV